MKQETKHTPGPWTIEGENADTTRPAIVGPDNYPIAYIEQGHETDPTANAHLIAAAPDLLTACNYALGVLGSIPEEYAEQIADILDESIDTALLETAIAKAESSS